MEPQRLFEAVQAGFWPGCWLWNCKVAWQQIIPSNTNWRSFSCAWNTLKIKGKCPNITSCCVTLLRWWMLLFPFGNHLNVKTKNASWLSTTSFSPRIIYLNQTQTFSLNNLLSSVNHFWMNLQPGHLLCLLRPTQSPVLCLHGSELGSHTSLLESLQDLLLTLTKVVGKVMCKYFDIRIN